MIMKYTLSDKDDIQILSISNLVNEFDKKEILSAALVKIEDGFPNFVVDLGHIDYMNSVGLNFLLTLKNRSTQSGGNMALLNTPKKVIELLEMTKLVNHFDMTSSLDEAIETLSKYG